MPRWAAVICEGVMKRRDRKANRAILSISGIMKVNGVRDKRVRGKRDRRTTPLLRRALRGGRG